MKISGPTFLKVYRDNSDGAVFKKVGPDIIMWLCNPMRHGAIGVPGQFMSSSQVCPKRDRERAHGKFWNSLHCEVSDILIPTTMLRKNLIEDVTLLPT